jgi:hypothetical protein
LVNCRTVAPLTGFVLTVSSDGRVVPGAEVII